MGADNSIDRVARKARLLEFFEKWQVEVAPVFESRTVFVVADAGIDQDAPPFRFNEQRMDAQLELAVAIGKGVKPFALLIDVLGRGIGQDHRAIPNRFLFLQPGNPDVPNLPGTHCFSSSFDTGLLFFGSHSYSLPSPGRGIRKIPAIAKTIAFVPRAPLGVDGNIPVLPRQSS